MGVLMRLSLWSGFVKGAVGARRVRGVRGAREPRAAGRLPHAGRAAQVSLLTIQ
jgi:hypothetical protein